MAIRTIICQKVVEEGCHLPLSYFETHHLGLAASLCNAIADLPRSLVAQRCLSTSGSVGIYVVRDLEWKSLDGMHHLEWWVMDSRC